MKVIPIDRASLRRLPDVVEHGRRPAACGPDRRRLPGGHHLVRPGVRTVPAGDVPGRRRRGQAGAAAAAELSPPRRQAVDGGRLRRRRHVDGVDPPAGHRPPHGRARAGRVAAAAGNRPAGSGGPLRGRGPRRRGAARRTGTPWWPDRGIGTAVAVAATWNGYGLEQDGLPRSRRHHPDAPCCHRGDDGCAGDGRQRVVAARHGPGGAPPDGGVARDAGHTCSARGRRR